MHGAAHLGGQGQLAPLAEGLGRRFRQGARAGQVRAGLRYIAGVAELRVSFLMLLIVGTASYNSLRGPGATNLDASVFRDFHLWERVSMQFRAEAFNATNTPHFGNPTANVSSVAYDSNGNITNLNGFGQITSLSPLGRLIDPRYMRFGVRFTF